MKEKRNKEESNISNSRDNTGEVDLDFVERDQDEQSESDSLRTDSDEDI
jgi:hypothetical protein